MRVTQRKGDTAVAQAIATFTRSGLDVAIPLTESAPYDLIVLNNHSIFRVQVRYVSGKQVDLRNIHSNATGYVVKKSRANAYDWLYVYTQHGTEYLFKQCFSNRRSVNLSARNEIAKVLKTI